MTMRTWFCTVCLIGVIGIFASGAVLADPSYFGYTGLIRIPTAEALSEDEFNMAAFHIEKSEFDDPEVYAGNLGVADDVEVGLAIIRRDGGTDDVFINGKYSFRGETESRPALAAGIVDLASEVDATVYFTMSQGFGKRKETRYGTVSQAEFHAGFGGGQLDGLFGGVSANLGDAVKLMVEYDSEDFNLGARFKLGNQFRGDVALFDWGDLGFGVSYNQLY